MGRRSRHSAKTGDQSIYKSRNNNDASSKHQSDDDDDDPLYNEVDRYHNRKEEENYLKLDIGDDNGNSSSEEEDDGITTKQEGVFDLGIGGDSSDEDDDEDDESEDSEDDKYRETQRKKRQKVKDMEEALASSSDDDDSDNSDDEEDENGDGKSSQLLNWGDKKHSYYHGDTADLEIGQDVDDAYLEEEAGREVERARLDGMDDADFMLDGGDSSMNNEVDKEEEEGGKISKKKKKRSKNMDKLVEDETTTVIQPKKKQKNQLSSKKLTKKEKLKILKTNHPELLPLVQHFTNPIEEFSTTTLMATGALLKNGVRKGIKEAEAVGTTPAGLQYLITKSMLQASKALNLSLYLLLKSDQASSKKRNAHNLGMTSMSASSLMMDDDNDNDDIRNHPVMDRLNQLSQLTDKLQEGVEEKIPGLKEQLNSLVKAAALMAGGDLSSSSDDDSDEDDGSNSSSREMSYSDVLSDVKQVASDDVVDNNEESLSSDSDEDKKTQESIQRRVMTEARFAVRNQDIEQSSKKRKRGLALSSTLDYGDETEDITDKAIDASRKLASTMNSIVQKSNTSNEKRKKKLVGDEMEGGEDEEYDRLQQGLSMMEEQFGMGSDDNDNDNEVEVDDEGLGSDDDDFYSLIKSKSKAKKEAKKQMYAVAPKYPRLEGVVEGERAIGHTIMKNRGLVAHKAKINRNPRVKKREQYRKALIRRKGAVREIRTDEGHVYGGEATGIKSGISRSRKLN